MSENKTNIKISVDTPTEYTSLKKEDIKRPSDDRE